MILEAYPTEFKLPTGKPASYRRIGDICEVYVDKNYASEVKRCEDLIPPGIGKGTIQSYHYFEYSSLYCFKMENWATKVEYRRPKQMHKLNILFPGTFEDLEEFLRSKGLTVEFAEPGMGSDLGILTIEGEGLK